MIYLLTILACAAIAWIVALLLFNAISGLEIGNNGDVDLKIGLILDKKLDNFVVGVQKEIPMAAGFLAGPMGDKLKMQAKGEVMKAMPEVKEHLKKGVFESKTWHIMKKKVQMRALLIGAVIGVITAACQYAIEMYYGS
ncbi:MAG: hypothetical protein H7A37_01855 [Chlamydiales bacterium]|nr:hypothetical protein [Chlamydiia bacterium]MCP5507034.1 hypothetical protein [Chlamydiales bacterium]